MQFIKKLLPHWYKRQIKEQLGVPTLHWTFENIKRLGFKPSFVVDCGAYEGHWTEDFLEVFPGTKLLMLDAQSSKQEKLQNISNRFPSAQLHIALLSAEDGKEFSFYEDESNSHVTKNNSGNVTKKGEALDAILQRKQLPYPDFLKLDVQGFELEVLRGGAKSLEHAEFCLLEVTLIDLDNGDPLMLEVMQFMNERGFQPYDISTLMRRPFDNALFQIDLLFIKKSSKLISEKRWC